MRNHFTLWSTEGPLRSISHLGIKERVGTATVLFSCQPLHAPEAVWELSKIEVPFSVKEDVLQFGGNFEAVQQYAELVHDAVCSGHQGDHHFMVTAGFTYRQN